MAKRDLAKLVVAALVLAANTTSVVQASEESTVDGIFLAAAACGSHCGGASKRNEISDNSTRSDYYNANNNAYQTGTSTYSNPSSSSTYGNPNYGNSNYTDSSSRYNNSTADTYANPGVNTYGATTSSNWTDEEFRAQLNSDQKKDFDKLNASGKALAKSLANDPKYADKNAAVKEALKRQNNNSTTTNSSYSR